MKGKGKKHANGPSKSLKCKEAPTEEDTDAKRCRGDRAAGTANYSAEDLEALFDILEESLPISGHAWNNVTDKFGHWAEENGRPVCTSKSLKAKFKQLVKTTKPTGDAYCPPQVERAQKIEFLMNKKAGTRDLDDSEIVDAYEDNIIEISSNEEDADDNETLAPCKKASKKPIIKTEPGSVPKPLGPIARRAAMNRLTVSTALSHPLRRGAHDLLATLSSALDPSFQVARDDEHASRSLHTTQLFTMSQQLRDAQATIESLCSHLLEADQEQQAAERRLDRAELKAMMSAGCFQDAHSPYCHHTQYCVDSPQAKPCYWREDTVHLDGNQITRWRGNSDEDTNEFLSRGVLTPSPTARTAHTTFKWDDDNPAPSPPSIQPSRHCSPPTFYAGSSSTIVGTPHKHLDQTSSGLVVVSKDPISAEI
ncbi:hypothetical protein C0991_001600 [Blastosporella zonata]|nr:hypothetical protein C0991_001600 [Blastosporella zonata]